MPIRRDPPSTTNRTTAQPATSGAGPQGFDALQAEIAELAKAGDGLKKGALEGLIAKAEAAGPDVVQKLQAELKTATSDGRLEVKSPAAEKLLGEFLGDGAAAPATDKDAPDLKLVLPPQIDDKDRMDVGEEAARKLLDTVKRHANVSGHGQESAGKGDPRITQRRSAVATLIANKSGGLGYKQALEALGPNVQADIKWLLQAERTEYKLDGDSSMFSWTKSGMAGADSIHDTFRSRVSTQKALATSIDNGSKEVFDASSTSVVGLSMIEDTDKRANSFVDTLLQFRARTDVDAGDSDRSDKIAPALIAEQRILLAAAELGMDSPAKVREYALLREVIASHPTSNVNGVFEARNAVGAIFMTGSKEWGSSEGPMAWIRHEKAPGATESAYTSIHHNFSRDTPNNVRKTFEAWVFPKGPEARRPELFVNLVDIQAAADRGEFVGARRMLQEMHPTDQKTVADLLTKLKGAADEDVGLLIRDFLVKSSEKPLSVTAETILGQMQDILKNNDSYWRTPEENLKNKIDGLPETVIEAFQPLLKSINYKSDDDIRAAIAAYVEKNKATLKPDSAQKLEELSKYAEGHPTLASKVKDFSSTIKTEAKELFDSLKPMEATEAGKLIHKFAEDNKDKPFPDLMTATNLDLFARLYRSVCEDQPTANTLEKNLFRAGPAWKDVADVIAQLRDGTDLGAMKELGEARLAMRDAIVGAETGFERHEMIKLDADLNRLTCTELGACVDRIGSVETDEQKTEALVGIQTALRSAIASGLHELKDFTDPASSKGEGLDALLVEVDKAIGSGKINEADYRALMGRTYVAIKGTTQNMRAFIDGRAPSVSNLGAELDPEFMDQFSKQTSLHYATAIAQKAVMAGLKEEIGPRCVSNIDGMRVLNSVGPVVFDSVYFAENTKDLVKMQPPKDAMTVVYGLEEKKMVAVGGLIVDNEHAPGGNSHLNMYAMNNGITVLALPELRTKYAELFENAKNEGGLYVDDSNFEFKMMTVDYAVENGFVKKADLESLRPGTNKKISYLKSKGLNEGFEKIGYHEAMISPDRITREVELYVPMDEVDGVGKRCTSFDDLAKLGVHARHLAGEKGTVLALLKAHPKLAKYVPDGSQVTTGRCRMLLEDAGIWKEWDAVFRNDPDVGVVHDDNFLKSKFYTDPDFRSTTRQHLQDITREKLTELLIETPDQTGLPADVTMKDLKLWQDALAKFDGAWPHEDATVNTKKGDQAALDETLKDSGKTADEVRGLVEKFAPKLTEKGKELYSELMANPALAASDNWITRSSFTGEDRPGKSGAGQYESFPGLRDPVSRCEGVVGVLESTWMPEPVENNIADEVNLDHIMCSIVVQDCLNPTESGVMISRDTEHGTRGKVSYQLVVGFGGGVEGGKTEEGVIGASGHTVNIQHPERPDGMVDEAALKELRELVLETEKYFNEVVEPGMGHAVDMEVAREDGQWKIVQARVIQIDK